MNARKLVAAVALVAAIAAVAAMPARAASSVPRTVSGIPLDAPWKVKIYAFARKHFHHPAWGWQHSERDYRLALEFATEDKLPIDRDALFAAAMMHDMAAFAPWAKANVEHGDLAATDCVPILRDAGFPMRRIAAVQAAERGHMFYRTPHGSEAIVLHDADSVDFLGAIGADRIIATVGATASTTRGAVASLRGSLHDIPPKLITKAAKRAAVPRIAQLRAFLDALDAQSYGGVL